MNALSRALRVALVGALLLALAACVPNRKEIRAAVEAAAVEQDRALTCTQADHCAIASPLRELGALALAGAAPGGPQHRVLLLDDGSDALLARIHMLRAAQTSIEMQSFIFAEDDVGYFILDELLQAARRGVKVRVLLDQLFSVDDVELLARLAQAHQNFELRLYNPTFGEARTNAAQVVAGLLCCFTRLNQRMHNKLLLVDGRVGITGGRNYQNRYFDWDATFNYRDRDILVAGPVAQDMQASFDAFWEHRQSIPIAALTDVRPYIGAPARTRPAPRLTRAAQIETMGKEASDAALIERRFASRARLVGRVDYVSDAPNKPFVRDLPAKRDLTRRLQNLLRRAEGRIVLQTPYLVFSRGARRVFRELAARSRPPTITVSTNSLAATDAFYVYALSHKYKRRYLRDYRFRIYEFKPFPLAGIDPGFHVGPMIEALGADAREARPAFGSASGVGSIGQLRGPVPLTREGARTGLHAKSLVIDDSIGIVGTHNFDPRSDRLNTESAVIVHDAGFAAELAAIILHDTAPGNAWTVAQRPRPFLLAGVNYSLGKLFEALPLFDFWPFRYATSYELKPGCAPLPPEHPGFHECYTPVGDFPEVGLPLKAIYTRVLTAFGAGLTPIL